MPALRVLLIYQDAVIVSLMVEALTGMGMEVRSVHDISKAILLASRERFSGILIDPTIPFAYGCEVARPIPQSTDNRGTPMYVLTVRQDNYVTAQAFDVTGTYFLQEPIEIDGLQR